MCARLAEFTAWLAGLDAAELSDRERVDALADLQGVAAAVGGAQAELTAAYADSQRALGCTARGVATEVALARRVGLSRGMDLVRRSRILVADLPETTALMRSGDLDEHRGLLLAERVAVLDPAVRGVVDEVLADDLDALSDAELRTAVDRAVAGIDPDAVQRRREDALAGRHVRVRSAPDGMAELTIRCCAVDAAVAVQSLGRHADAVLAGVGGCAATPEEADGRSRDAIMADAALSWLTGRDTYEGPAVEVHLVLTAGALLGRPGPRGGRDSGGRDSGGPGEGGSSHGEGGSGHGGGGSGKPGRGGSDGPGGGSGGDDRGSPGQGGGSPGGWSFDPTPGQVVGVGPIPAATARRLLGLGTDHAHDPTDPGTRPGETAARGRRADREARRVTIRRVWASHDGTRIVGIDRRRQIVPPRLRAVWAPGPDHPAHATGTGLASVTGPDWSDPRLAYLRTELSRPPGPDQLLALSSPERCYTGGLRRFIELRDQTCRVPFCGAPIRHVDHLTPWRDLPETTASGGIGACVGHNLAKEDPGHHTTLTADGLTTGHPHQITWTTPTGRTITSTAPPVLGWGSNRADPSAPHGPRPLETNELSPLEAALAHRLAA